MKRMKIMSGKLPLILLGAIVLLVVGALLSLIIGGYSSSESITLRLGEGRFAARVVEKRSDRIKGLSGSKNLPSDQALLFIFPSSAKWKIWMKDMNYSIDIVWLDESKKVIDIVENATPESYPEQFEPREPARYVIEVISGTVKNESIKIGQQAVFDMERGSA